MPFAPSAAGSPDGVGRSIFVTPPAPNYQLDQAVNALAMPPADDDNLDTDTGVQSSGVRALFGLGHPTTGPFPSNIFTVPDRTQNTGRRINLPLPDCKVYVSDCEDLAAINELDGFNPQPRLSVPFDGPIDVYSISTVFLVSLGSTREHDWMPRGTVVGINQVVWDPETNTLHVESDELLAQHTRFALLAGGRGTDFNGDNLIGSNEGGGTLKSPSVVQAVADFMQLVRVVQVGVDVDGDGVRDLDPARISFVGTSLGANVGVPLAVIDPEVRAAVLGVAAAFSPDLTSRLGPDQRANVGSNLAGRVPSLLNEPGVSAIDGVPVDAPYFHENLPLRSGAPLAVTLADGSSEVIQSPVINTVAGAMTSVE